MAAPPARANLITVSFRGVVNETSASLRPTRFTPGEGIELTIRYDDAAVDTAADPTLGFYQLSYDPTAGLPFIPGASLDLSTESGFRFSFLPNTGFVTARVRDQLTDSVQFLFTLSGGTSVEFGPSPPKQDGFSLGRPPDASDFTRFATGTVEFGRETGPVSGIAFIGTIAAVPEPSTLAMAAVAEMCGLGFALRRCMNSRPWPSHAGSDDLSSEGCQWKESPMPWSTP